MAKFNRMAKELYNLLLINSDQTNYELSSKLGVCDRQIRRYLTYLEKLGKIKVEIDRRKTLAVFGNRFWTKREIKILPDLSPDVF